MRSWRPSARSVTLWPSPSSDFELENAKDFKAAALALGGTETEGRRRTKIKSSVKSDLGFSIRLGFRFNPLFELPVAETADRF
jgi:hypothetical protein